MRVPILASSLGLACALTAAACSSTSQSTVANLNVEAMDSIKGTSWTACNAQGACRFNGMGYSEGPACARSIQGTVVFIDKNQQGITTNIQLFPSGQDFVWLQSPNVDAVIHPNDTFAYTTTISIPAAVVKAAVMYTSKVAGADVRPC